MDRKVLCGIAVAVALLLVVTIGGFLTTTYAQNADNGKPSVQQVEEPFGFKLRSWFKCRICPFKGLIQISPEYNETVMRILSSNSDVKSLLDQGYSVVSIRPIVTAYVQADGTVVFKAEKVIVALSNGKIVVTYVVDVVSGSVTHIATMNLNAIKELRGKTLRGS